MHESAGRQWGLPVFICQGQAIFHEPVAFPTRPKHIERSARH
jgi:hypothetical protein